MAQCKSFRSRMGLTVSVAALFIGSGTAAYAQNAEQAVSVDDIIVTAQKREESIRDVPIAVSAFTADMLDSMKIEGGSELLRAIPNVTFSKSNFSMYNFAIRGIGTKALSAASDPAVAISFNNTPILRNRLFESEYLDVKRVEVLRGPQGTLYGRNATAGVVNMLPNLPSPDFDAWVRVEAGNYETMRGQAMINLPLSDTFWVRAASSYTNRDGFDYNTFKDEKVNGGDLWSTRLSLAWEPTSRFRSNLIWEHFEEDDDRLRTGKQLCTRAPGITQVRSATVGPGDANRLSQGCLPGSLYTDEAYSAPNGGGLSQFFILPVTYGYTDATLATPVRAVDLNIDPYDGVTQSRNLREIATNYDPRYIAKNDIAQVNMEFDVSDTLTFYSQTAYAKDIFWATQDYARYMSNEIFNDSNGLLNVLGEPVTNNASPGGFYNDPQLGPSRRMEAADLSRSNNRQWSQEFRLQSNRDGMFNYSIGANYLDFKTTDNYFVFNNTFSFLSEYFYGRALGPIDVFDTVKCLDGSQGECSYVDYTSIDNLAGDGHNYFRSYNKVHTRSWALFGEGYWNIADNKRLTIGLRYTDDRKVTTPHTSQLLLGTWDEIGFGPSSGGNVARGYPALPDVKQSWDALTGRAVLDWKPTDGTMLYASYSRGYKGGGTNPPRADINTSVIQYQPLPETFDPEYVNAFEVGSKFLTRDGTFGLNVTAFYYDYKDYQVSQIVDRISLNENFDATSAGVEFEAVWRPMENLRLDANLGFLKTQIGKGAESIDVMNRTQGDENWMVLRPWVQVPSNCIAPTEHVEAIFNSPIGQALAPYALAALCGGAARVGSFDPNFQGQFPFWAFLGIDYNPLRDAPNGGRGIMANLEGNELPNAPRFTANFGAQYTWRLASSDLTLRGDYYRQADSYFRVYNTEYDKIRAWDNVNISIAWELPQRNMMVQAYVKNVFDDAPIVDAFTNSDDSLLTTNVFTLDPRVWGFALTKRF